jgi:multiple sugar transport system substrate-binding protein
MAIGSATILAASALALSACGGGSGSSGDSKVSNVSAQGKDDGAKLTMWSRAPLEKQAKNAVKLYNSTHTNQVKLEILPNDDVEGKVGGAVQSDSLPDILAGDVVRVPYWTQQGIFKDMTKQIDALPEKDDLQSGHIKAGTVDGKEHTLPFVSDISVMVWNKDLYKKAGLDPDKGPSTFQEYVDQAKAVAKLNQKGVSGTYVTGQSGGALVFTMLPILWASGDSPLNKEGTKANLDSADAKKLWAGYAELAKTKNGIGAGSKEETGATWTAPFQNGKVGVQQYPWTTVSSMLKDSKFDIGVKAIPGIDGGESTFLGGDAIGISKDSKHDAEAWNFLAWLMKDKTQQKVFADNNDTASNLNVLKDGYPKADARTKAANAVIEKGQTPIATNFNEAFNASGSPWQTLFQDVVWGKASKLKADNAAITSTLGQ